MKWIYFKENYESMAQLRLHFHRLCLAMHPDKHHDDDQEKWTDLFKQMYAEYENYLKVFIPQANQAEKNKGSKQTYNFDAESEIGKAIEKMMHFAGLTLEICGSWIWISGNTYKWKSELKAMNCKWQHTKGLWYFAGYEWKPRRAKIMDMDHIRTRYGSYTLEAEELNAIGA